MDMKKWVIIGLFTLMFACQRNSSRGYIPNDVLMAFNDTYPEAEKVKWEAHEESYLVRFRDGGETKEAVYQLDGAYVKEE
jgi:hypothetical protein